MSREWIAGLPKDRLIAEYSVWSANLLRIEDDLHRIAPHADVLHIDVADGHFAPAMLFFPDLVAGIRKVSKTPIHIHLMVSDAVLLSQTEQFIDAGADLVSVHAENANAQQAIQLIKSKGKAAGVVLRVETPVEKAASLISDISFLTLLGTAIGVKGQGLSDTACGRLQQAKEMIAGYKHRIVLAADGGIRENTVPDLRKAGAETVVLGSLAFGAPDLAQRMKWLKAL
jgi:ribulose-phosphate 3-epimerase